MASTTDVTQALRYAYGVNKILYLFNEESPTWKVLSKVKKPMGGRGQFIMPIAVRNAGAFTGITEAGALPTALQPTTAEATFSLQEYVGLYDVSWKLIQDARNNKFAFQQAIQQLDDGLKRRVMRNLNTDVIDDGRGRLAVMPAADNDTTVTVNALPRMDQGMVVDCMDTDDDTVHGNSLTVTAVDVTNRTITLSGSVSSTAAGDYFVIQDTADDSQNDSLHSNGLIGIIDDANPASIVGNYGGINRSTAGNEYWEALVLDNSGTNRALNEDLMLQALDGARERGGGEINAWFSNLRIARRYHEMLRAESYFAFGSAQPLSGGFGRTKKAVAEDGKSQYEFSGVPWYHDPYFGANTLVGVDTNHFFIGVGENETPRPISDIFDNIPFFRQTSNATFEVAWYYQMELLSDNPASGVKIEDVAET
jgi:hypothetical protein